LAWVFAVLLPLVARGQVPVPEAVKTSAVAAVEALGQKVVYGDHAAAVERMYPRWRKRMAKRLGGEEEVASKLASVGEEMARKGVSIISFKTLGEPTAYEVWPGKTPPDSTETVYDKWLLFIPTRVQIRMIEEDSPRAQVWNKFSFQVAIADKEALDWTFIDGATMSVSDLRSLFASLPANLELPLVKWEQAK
jgi:hypothetical protein